MSATVQNRGSFTGHKMPRPSKEPDQSTYSGQIGALIRERREKLGLSVQSVADALGVSHMTVYKWESGGNPIPVNCLPDIATALKTSVRKLIP